MKTEEGYVSVDVMWSTDSDSLVRWENNRYGRGGSSTSLQRGERTVLRLISPKMNGISVGSKRNKVMEGAKKGNWM